MNIRISITLVIVFFVVFSSFFIFHNAFSDISSEKFYLQKFDPNKKKIFIYGSSHVIQLNNTHINNQISNEYENYIIYNMGENGDTPKRRYLNVEKDISLNPEIIFYGIAFRDFNSYTGNNDLQNTDYRLVDILPLDTTEIENINPKLTTLQVVRSFFIDILSDKPNRDIPYPNNPAFSDKFTEEILSKEELSNKKVSLQLYIAEKNNEQVEYFKKIVNSLNKAGIKVVIFITPYSSVELESINGEEKRKFFTILSEIEEEHNVKIYNFSEKYADLEIWRDPTHVAFNSKAIIYSNEISKMILQEIDE